MHMRITATGARGNPPRREHTSACKLHAHARQIGALSKTHAKAPATTVACAVDLRSGFPTSATAPNCCYDRAGSRNVGSSYVLCMGQVHSPELIERFLRMDEAPG